MPTSGEYNQWGSNYNAPVSFDEQAQHNYSGNAGQQPRAQGFRQPQQGTQPGTQTPNTQQNNGGANGQHSNVPAPTPTQGMTFAQMQQQGYARPPMPTPQAQGAPQGQQQPLNLEQNLMGAYQNYQGSPYFQSHGTQTGQFTNPNQGTGISTSTANSVQGLLDNPSPYLSDAFTSAYNKVTGEIDDDYNRRDASLHGNIASRGLDATGTIGATNQTFQNLQRRTAKSDASNALLQNLAQTYGSDRSNAINTALGYGSNNYSQGLGTYNANANTNQQNYGQNLGTYQANLGANAQNNAQRNQALQNLLGFGQNAFNNQLTTQQLYNNQDQQEFQNQLQLYNLGLA